MTTSPPVVPQTPRNEDAELIARLLDGNEDAYAELVQRYYLPLKRLAMAFVSSQAVAEEVVQETWLAVLKGLPAFEGRSSLKTWIFRILTNRAKTRGVREGRTIPFAALDLKHQNEPVFDPTRFVGYGAWMHPRRGFNRGTPEKQTLMAEARAQVETAIDELPSKQRSVVRLRDLYGWSSAEVCKQMDISETYQRVLLHRGRVKVRTQLQEYLNG